MSVYRSPLRLFLLGVVGLILIVASIDVMFAYRVSTEPENTDGVLSTRGQAQQRGDILWGAVMFGTGTLLFGGGIIELVRRRPVVRIREEGFTASIGTTHPYVTIPWSRIESISSTVTKDDYDGGLREQHSLLSSLIGQAFHLMLSRLSGTETNSTSMQEIGPRG